MPAKTCHSINFTIVLCIRELVSPLRRLLREAPALVFEILVSMVLHRKVKIIQIQMYLKYFCMYKMFFFWLQFLILVNKLHQNDLKLKKREKNLSK